MLPLMFQTAFLSVKTISIFHCSQRVIYFESSWLHGKSQQKLPKKVVLTSKAYGRRQKIILLPKTLSLKQVKVKKKYFAMLYLDRSLFGDSLNFYCWSYLELWVLTVDEYLLIKQMRNFRHFSVAKKLLITWVHGIHAHSRGPGGRKNVDFFFLKEIVHKNWLLHVGTI